MRAQLIWKPWLSLTRTSRVQIRRRAYFQLLLQRLASSASAGPKNSWSCVGWQDLRALVTSQSSCCQHRAKLDLMIGHLDIWHHRRQTCSSKPSFLILQGNLAVDVLRPIQQRQLPSAGRQSVKSVVEMGATALYSRDIASAALRKFQKVIALIRDEALRHDANRSGMVTPRPPPILPRLGLWLQWQELLLLEAGCQQPLVRGELGWQHVGKYSPGSPYQGAARSDTKSEAGGAWTWSKKWAAAMVWPE